MGHYNCLFIRNNQIFWAAVKIYDVQKIYDFLTAVKTESFDVYEIIKNLSKIHRIFGAQKFPIFVSFDFCEIEMQSISIFSIS